MAIPAPRFVTLPSGLITGEYVAVLPMNPTTGAAAPISISAVAYAEADTEYVTLVPTGHTSDIFINEITLESMGPQVVDKGEILLAVETPAGSGLWSYELGRVLDGNPQRQQSWNFGEGTQGVPVKSTDNVCCVLTSQGYTSGVSPDYGTSLLRSARVDIKYTLTSP